MESERRNSKAIDLSAAGILKEFTCFIIFLNTTLRFIDYRKILKRIVDFPVDFSTFFTTENATICRIVAFVVVIMLILLPDDQLRLSLISMRILPSLLRPGLFLARQLSQVQQPQMLS